jgi:hypothetical protein
VRHDDLIHQQARLSGDFADEELYEDAPVGVSLIHFADDSHGVRLDLHERGLTLVLDTPAWLDLDTVVTELGEPALSMGYAVVERLQDGDEVGYRLTVQGGDVVGTVSVILLEPELASLSSAFEASREAVEAADEVDHARQQPGDGVGEMPDGDPRG